MNQLRVLGYQLIMTSFMICFFINVMQSQISTQVGIGALYINGDVDPVFDPLNSFHIGLSKGIASNLNAELKFGFGKTVGLSGTCMESAAKGGGLIEDTYADLDESVWYPNYLSNHVYVDLGVNYIINTGIERLRVLGGAGIGFSVSNLNVNLLDFDTTNYNVKLPITNSVEQTKAAINRRYDSTYETKFDDAGIAPHLALQFGIQFRIARGIYFSVDARYHLTFSDYLDPIKNITATQESGNNDSVSMFTIGFVGYLLADEKEDRSPVK